jgi:WD40 repeat protein
MIRVLDVKTGEDVCHFTPYTIRMTNQHLRYPWVESITVSPDGRFAVSGYEDGTIYLWNLHLE